MAPSNFEISQVETEPKVAIKWLSSSKPCARWLHNPHNLGGPRSGEGIKRDFFILVNLAVSRVETHSKVATEPVTS